MKFPNNMLFFVGTVVCVDTLNAQPKGPMHRVAALPPSQLFGVSPNNLNLIGRQFCTDCGNGFCCEGLRECCEDGCCPIGTYCDTSYDPPCVCLGSCPDSSSYVPSGSASYSYSYSYSSAPVSSSSYSYSYSSAPVDSSSSSFSFSTPTLPSSSASGGPSSIAGGGTQPNAATTVSRRSLDWVGILGMVVAGGIGIAAFAL